MRKTCLLIFGVIVALAPTALARDGRQPKKTRVERATVSGAAIPIKGERQAPKVVFVNRRDDKAVQESANALTDEHLQSLRRR